MGTTSTTRRQSHVSAGMSGWCQERMLQAFTRIGRGDQTRGALLCAAATLAASGCLLSRTDAEIVAALLFVAAAVFALISLPPADAPVCQISPHSEPRPVAQRARPLPRTLQDLLVAQDAGGACDLAHWHRLTQRMSHELRTPLNAVLGFSELMASEVFGPLGAPQYQDYAVSINASGRILLKSAEDALAITNLLTGQNSRTRHAIASVSAAADDVLAFHAPELSKPGIALHIDVDAAVEVLAEPQTLRQILINLTSEALQHAASNTRLAITCHYDAGEVYVCFSCDGTNAHAAGKDSFSMMLVRTLVQLSQARMSEETSETRWCTTLVFPRAGQHDFFALNAA